MISRPKIISLKMTSEGGECLGLTNNVEERNYILMMIGVAT